MLLGVTARAHPALHAKLVADRAVTLSLTLTLTLILT